MLHRLEQKPLVWVDLESPTSDEIDHVVNEFKLVPAISEELASATIKPRVDLYQGYIYGVFHFPAFRHTHGAEENQEIDFVIGKDFIVTTHYETIDPIYDFSKTFEASALVGHASGKKKSGMHGGHVFFEMIRRLYRAADNELDYISDNISQIEHGIFAGKEKEMVEEISRASRELLNFKRILATHKEVLESLEIAADALFGSDFRSYIKVIAAESYRVMHRAESLLDSIAELRETNNSLLSTKQNEIMKILTIMAFVTFPLSLVSDIFAMNTVDTPIANGPYGFWIILGIMLLMAFAFFSYFKRKKWL